MATSTEYVQGVKLWGSNLFWFGPTSGGTVMGPSALFRYTGNPRAAFTRPAPLYTHFGTNWLDFDVQDANAVWVASMPSLLKVSGTGSSGWTATTYTSAAVQNLIAVAVSQSSATVYVATAYPATPFTSAVHAFDIASGAYIAQGQPIYVAPAGTQLRGELWACDDSYLRESVMFCRCYCSLCHIRYIHFVISALQASPLHPFSPRPL